MFKKVTSIFFVFILLMSIIQSPIRSYADSLDFTEEELQENDYILYFVNAGDATPETVENEDKMGLYASKTDQAYGLDEKTGKSWGLLTETVAPSRNDESTKEGTLLYYNGPQTADKAIEYQFEIPEGDYDLTFGFKNPWSGRNVNIILNDENVSDGDFYIGANNEVIEFVHRQFTVENGVLNVRIQGPNTEDLNNHNDPLINYIIIRQTVLIPIKDLEETIANAEQEISRDDYYTTSTLAKLQTAIDLAQAIVDQVNNGEIDVKEMQNEIFNAIQNISIAKSELKVKEGIGIGATPFITSENDKEVNNVKLQWTEVADTSNYILLRAEKDNEYEEIYSGSATMINDYGLDINQSYSYKVRAIEANGRYVESAVADFEPFHMPENAGYFHNNEEGGFQGDQPPGGIKVGDIYYSYRQENDENGFKQINLYISEDGDNWEFDKVVLDRDSHPDLKESKLESGKVFLNPNTGDIVGWYHYENNQDYSLARAGVASGKPGEEWTWHESLRPFDNESRDITYFIDDDGSGYIMSASNMNADFTLYELDETHTKIMREIDTIFKGQHREGPGFHKKGEYYYIFTSEAAGWYPTKGGYASAKSMEGPWTELRLTGNLSTFSSQSGYTFDVQGSETTSYFMNAYRWQHGWDLKPGGATDRWFLVTMNEGYAFYDYFEKIFIDYDTGYAIPLEDGMLVSQEKPAFAEKEQEGQEASKANDGNYYSSWVSNDAVWPTWWMVDLEEEYDITNIQISWYLHKGSEGAHRYTIETSTDGESFEQVFDGTDNKNYGFTSDYLNTKARYVRVNLLDAKLHNNPNNWYTPQLSEVKVFGNELEGDKTELLALLEDVEQLLEKVEVGEQVGQYSQTAVNNLSNIIEKARKIFDDKRANQQTVDNIKEELLQAKSTFLETVITGEDLEEEPEIPIVDTSELENRINELERLISEISTEHRSEIEKIEALLVEIKSKQIESEKQLQNIIVQLEEAMKQLEQLQNKENGEKETEEKLEEDKVGSEEGKDKNHNKGSLISTEESNADGKVLTQIGKKLPNTATNNYTQLLIGLSLFVFGSTLLVILIRKKLKS